MPPDEIMSKFDSNPFLKGLERFAIGHFATQGDGNHFAYVGHLKSTGHAALVTDHGSRGLGAQLYKRGMAVARRHTAIHAPKIPGHNAWIKASSEDGRAYWEAPLQIVQLWTKANHHAIHDLTATQSEMVSPIASGTNTTSSSERQMAYSTTVRGAAPELVRLLE